MSNKQTRDQNILSWQIVVVAVCFTIALIGMQNASSKQSRHDRFMQAQPDLVRRQNEFWLQLSGRQPPNIQTPSGKLVRDLRPLLQSPNLTPEPNSPLWPKSMEQLSVPPTPDYQGAQSEANVSIFQSLCDCGNFAPSFLHDFELVRTGNVDQLLKPIPSVPSSFTHTLTPNHWGVLKFLFGLLTLSGLFGLLIGRIWVKFVWSGSLGWSLQIADQPGKLAVLLLSWPVSVLLLATVTIKAGKTTAKNFFASTKKRIARRRWQRELSTMLGHSQNGQDFLEASSNLKRLQTLRQRGEHNQELTRALDAEILECRSLISAITQTLIHESSTSNRKIRDHLDAFSMAQDEVNALR